MNIKCDYCGSFYPETDPNCPNCGATNPRTAQTSVPKTIEELKAFCQSKNMPLEKMRFFIGVDYREPKAFGIYKDENGHFIVYKNKADGSRAVRYDGPDEAYAVNEIFQKLKSEVALRREMKATGQTPSTSKRKRDGISWITIIIVIILIALYVWPRGPETGYYLYNNDYYYYQDSSWYYYDAGSWILADTVDSLLADDASDYYQGGSYSGSYGVDDFSDSSYYEDSTDWDSDWDDSYDSWDSSGTDWSSDW